VGSTALIRTAIDAQTSGKRRRLVIALLRSWDVILALILFWALRTAVVYYGMKAIWSAVIGVVGIFRFTSKEFMTMSAYSFLPANEAI
jgi:hypothetical protein